MSEKLKRFCNQYNITIVDDMKRWLRRSPPRFFAYPEDADVIETATEVHSEKLYTLQIPESRLQTLIDMEDMFFRQRSNPEVKDMFDMLMEKEREERHFRNSSQAIKTAYEQYSTLLYMAGYQRKI
jgi:hypothetical protein